jgi:catechol 2,3-dioxygenase-like lactoylglutathione lyase family enzyme
MAYDERLAARVRALLASRADVSERKMFGGLTFMVGGNMCCGVNGDELIVRLDPGHEDDALARPHVRPMDFTGRRMRGFITVQQWHDRGAEFLTPPADHGHELRCYMRDPDGHLIEVGQSIPE